MRQFIRHPADIPIEVSPANGDGGPPPRLVNVAMGGLAFRSRRAFEVARIVKVRIACVRPPFETTARVAWCRACGDGYELGLAFVDPDDAFRARMVEQVCHIERYRRQVREREGRHLTQEQAAQEWIERHAARFPASGQET